MSRLLVLCPGLLALALVAGNVTGTQSPPEKTQQQTARGRVFHDRNGNRIYDEGEKLLSGIRVSNGQEIVTTDEQGQYALPIEDDTILFVIKPRNWRTPVSKHQLPQFYYIHKPAGSPKLKFPGVEPTGPLPESVDFPLYPHPEPDQFHALMFGDPQPRNQKEIDYMAHDVIEDLIGTDASFGVTLGDIVFDDLSLFEPQAKLIALLGIPWYNVIGNHDINYDAHHDRHSDETFERVFGPAYYSFDHGPVHFLVVDDIEWLVDERGKGRYRGGLDQRQMEFIKNDLAMIPEDQLVVLLMHIPLMNVHNRQELYRLIEQRPFSLSVSAHMHVHQHRFITREDGWRGPEPHHHVVNVTVCGSWWRGAPDERGIPHAMMSDGAPNGYSILSFDGHKYAFEFRAAGRPGTHQMEIHAPNEVSGEQSGNTTVYANVFNGNEKSTVKLRIAGGEWVVMQKTLEMDPAYVQRFKFEADLQKGKWLEMVKPAISRHLWKVNLPSGLPAGTHVIEVQSSNGNGKTVSGRRVIRIR